MFWIQFACQLVLLLAFMANVIDNASNIKTDEDGWRVWGAVLLVATVLWGAGLFSTFRYFI